METTFTALSDGWNAEPNAPNPEIVVEGNKVMLNFDMNCFRYPEFAPEDWGQIVFTDCWRYRLGATNDEGWYRGQCRFSHRAPEWGKFFEIEGDLLLNDPSITWNEIATHPPLGSRHFLFYFRDQTFECDASNWTLTVHSSPRPRN